MIARQLRRGGTEMASTRQVRAAKQNVQTGGAGSEAESNDRQSP